MRNFKLVLKLNYFLKFTCKFKPYSNLYICVLSALNVASFADVPGLVKQRPIKWAYDKCQDELKQDSLNNHPDIPNRFNRFMTLVTEMRKLADEGEQFLYTKARADGFLEDTLLLEMIEMKRES